MSPTDVCTCEMTGLRSWADLGGSEMTEHSGTVNGSGQAEDGGPAATTVSLAHSMAEAFAPVTSMQRAVTGSSMRNDCSLE